MADRTGLCFLVMAEPLPRSPELMQPEDTALLVVDVQQRLLGVQPQPDHTVFVEESWPR